MSGALWMDPDSADSSPIDKKLDPRFHMGPQLDAAATKENGGVPVHKEVPYISLAIPGDKSLVIDRPVWDDPLEPMSDVNRWPREWAAFTKGSAESIQGTPLSDWPAITRSQVETLAYFRVRTLEQLASLSDVNLQKIQGGVALRQKAQEALDAKDGRALKERDARLAAQEASLSEMASQLAELKRQNEAKKPQK